MSIDPATLRRMTIALTTIVLAIGFAPAVAAQPGSGLDRAMGELGGTGQPLSLSLQILLMMSLLTVLPSLLLMMTSFTRIIIVLSILRHALGLQQTPPNQVLVGLSLFLSLFVMQPALSEINRVAVEPYGAEQIQMTEAVERAGVVMHGFMLKQTRKSDLAMFAKIAKAPPIARPQDTPFSILLPAFVTSELKTAFQIGFLIFLPFLIIDLIIASALMSLGMMMLSPTIISMPFKLLLFVLVDGWALAMGSLAASFEVSRVEADFFIGIAQSGLWVLCLAAAPILLPILVVGVFLGMVQAATSINEQTLTFVPKLVVAAVCLALFGTSMMVLLTDFTREMFAQIPLLVR